MARRFSAPYQSEPVSGLATWSRNLAMFSVVAVMVSILIVRFGFLEMKPALATFFGALGCAALSILVGFAAFAAIWQNGSRGMGRILLAFLINALVLAYPAYLAVQYQRLPPLYDITTNPIDPPRFEALARLRQCGLDAVVPGLQQPVLGICLGMQLLHETSQEGEVDCLGIIPGRSTTSPPTRSTRRASRRWRGCAPATAPTPPSMPGSTPPSGSGSPIPISKPWNSRPPSTAPMQWRCNW